MLLLFVTVWVWNNIVPCFGLGSLIGPHSNAFYTVKFGFFSSKNPHIAVFSSKIIDKVHRFLTKTKQCESKKEPTCTDTNYTYRQSMRNCDTVVYPIYTTTAEIPLSLNVATS